MKQFKDSIYGYIRIPKDIVAKIIDTPEFQRLRYIKQTSYLPVYASALHNRFVHSLGVYYLGRKASQSIFKNSDKILEEYSIDDNIQALFELACLLHDVGHAPFSHSGENFYIDENKTLYEKLKLEVGESTFCADVDYYHENGRTAAPHEIMSVIVALIRFSEFFRDETERDFFARCITGYKYRDTDKNTKHAVLNAFISLLNSSTIDVDRLDYLIRDAYVMGYNSISIDYNRLLESVMLVKVQKATNSPIQLAYRKSALSVIENVIYAHDSEKKWIQNHPVILYEVFLIQRLLTAVKIEYKKQSGMDLFSLDSLAPQKQGENTNKQIKGINEKLKSIIDSIPDDETNRILLAQLNVVSNQLNGLDIPVNISLLCDDDVIHLAKTTGVLFSDELFNRGIRRHPVWKSESEYKIYLDGYIGDDSYDELQSQIKVLNKFLFEEAPSPVINSEAIICCENCLNQIPLSELSPADKEDMENRYSLILRWLKMFEKTKEDQNLTYFDFLIIPTSKFESSFKKSDLSNIPIYFPESDKVHSLGKLINLFSVKDVDRRTFFYVFWKKGENDLIDAHKIGKEIAKLVLE